VTDRQTDRKLQRVCGESGVGKEGCMTRV
jgi:hypothetical protein